MTGILKLVSLAPVLPYIIGGVLVAGTAGGFYLHHTGYESGVTDERHKWQDANRELMRLRQEAADNATIKRDTDTAALGGVTERVIERSKTYYVDRPTERAAICLPADRVFSVQGARREIAAASGGLVSGEADTDTERAGRANP